MKFRLGLCIVALFIAFFAANFSSAQFSSFAEPDKQIMTPDALCISLVEQAVAAVGSLCGSLGRNVACYGNRTVAVDFRPNSSLTFNQSGDVVDLLAIQRLSTTPLNPQTSDWGIALLKAQANLPDSLPGQNVTFLLFGDTTLDNPSSDMQAVTVNTRIGAPACVGAPNAALLIQSPEGSQVSMNLNGADITLGSTAFVTAIQNDYLTFSIVEGTGIITADGETRVVLPGAQVRIPLGTPDGLHVIGAPSDLEPFDFDSIHLSPLSLLDRPVVVPPPIGSLFITPTPTNTISPCFPRADWAYLYVVPRGDTLSSIAQRIGMSTAALAEGNCITNANILIAGQTILSPLPVPPPVRKTPTPFCGNSVCESGESIDSCEVDCAPDPVCGNDVCEIGEDGTSCAEDCIL